jgi:hypothetical protein
LFVDKFFGTGRFAAAFDRRFLREATMTNRNMVKDAGKVTSSKMPEPSQAGPVPVPAPESDPQVWTTRDPVDSPQPKPQIRQERTKSLRKP